MAENQNEIVITMDVCGFSSNYENVLVLSLIATQKKHFFFLLTFSNSLVKIPFLQMSKMCQKIVNLNFKTVLRNKISLLEHFPIKIKNAYEIGLLVWSIRYASSHTCSFLEYRKIALCYSDLL